MSTAEYERLGEIREELESIGTMLSVFYAIAIFAVALYLYRASGVSVQWLTS